MNFQDSTTILNASIKKSGTLLNAPRIYIYIYTCVHTFIYIRIYMYIYIYIYIISGNVIKLGLVIYIYIYGGTIKLSS